MNRTTIPLSEILIENRQRTDYGDIDELADSIRRFGLIQPIVINQDKRLIAGGRRYAAHIKLGLPTIDVVFKETLSIDELHEMELEENLRRKEMLWTEKVLNIKTIHDLKSKRAALEGTSWTQRATGEMLGIKGVSNVNYALRVAELIIKKDQEILACENLSEAQRLLLRRTEEEINAELVSRSKITIGIPKTMNGFATFGVVQPIKITEPIPVEDKQIAKERYLSNPLNPPDEFDSYYEEKKLLDSKIEQHRITIPLSKMLYCCDSIEFMSHPDVAETFDAIITDIPYGINMDMLNQGNDGHAFKDIDTVLEEHTIEGNEILFKKFFPAAYKCLKNNTFLVTFCDMWQWRAMADLAIASGFKVQRWPFLWVKSHTCMNQSANTNLTKTFEVALICRKGTPTLTRTNINSHLVTCHDDFKDTLGHPFVKPFNLWEYIINATTISGQTILEPFAGRGSGVISMSRTGRNFIGCELNVEHFNALVENLKQHYLKQNPNLIFT